MKTRDRTGTTCLSHYYYRLDESSFFFFIFLKISARGVHICILSTPLQKRSHIQCNCGGGLEELPKNYPAKHKNIYLKDAKGGRRERRERESKICMHLHNRLLHSLRARACSPNVCVVAGDVVCMHGGVECNCTRFSLFFIYLLD